MTRVVIHIGLPKTGTTTLQEALFAKHPQIRPFVKAGTKHLIAADRRRFHENRLAIQRYIEPEAGDSRVTVVSDESLSMAEYTTLRQQRWGMQLSSDHEEMARRIAEAFHDPLVLIVIREQTGFLESLYAQHIKTQGVHANPPDVMDQWIEKEIDNAPYRSLVNLLKYEEMYEAYTALLGRSRVAVLAFEEMVHAPETFASRLAYTLDINVNDTIRLLHSEHRNARRHSFSPGYLRSIRQNQILKVGRLLMPPRFRQWVYEKAAIPTPRFSPSSRQRIAEFFAPHNRRFEEMTEYRLQEFGYPI